MNTSAQTTEKTRYIIYDGDGNGDIYVLPRCSECYRFVTKGKILENGLGELKFSDWKCKKHGEIEPFYFRD